MSDKENNQIIVNTACDADKPVKYCITTDMGIFPLYTIFKLPMNYEACFIQ